jgi:hypothetical protein
VKKAFCRSSPVTQASCAVYSFYKSRNDICLSSENPSDNLGMDQGICSSCGVTAPASSITVRNGQAFCDACLGAPLSAAPPQTSATSAAPGGPFCVRCGTQAIGGTQSLIVGRQPFCAPCHALVSAWPYPSWLKRSLVALLALLVIALIHGRKYFEAGRFLYRGEQLVDAGKYAESLPFLQETLKIAPRSDKAVLLTAKGALLTGNFQVAQKALQGHDHGRFDDASTAEFREVNGLWERAVDALDEADKAEKLEEEDGKAAEAARMMHDAAAKYPQLKNLSFFAETFDGGAAFESKDYDKFLAISERQWKQLPNANTAGMLASALACKYAITGDASLKQRSEEMIAKATQMVQGNAEATASVQEFVERNNYRLKSREIITKTEFDKRFRSGKTDTH